MTKVLCVALPTPLNQCFDYLSEQSVKRGCRVEVSFGTRKLIGIVDGQKTHSNIARHKLKKIIRIVDDKPIIDSETQQFLHWCARYYHHPIGEVFATALPKRLRDGNDALITTAKQPLHIQPPTPITLNQAQKHVVDVISQTSGFNVFLLHGVTGSGKTEVYLQFIKTFLAAKKQVLVLVPEIGITPQMITRFEQRLGVAVSVFHSQLNEREKVNTYLKAKHNQAGVILGTRSAIFMPVKNLAMIIVDEEHDESFKQQSGLRYSAKHLSFIRAKQLNIPLILGSATPSLELLKNTTEGKVIRLKLSQRAGKAKPPAVHIIDTRSQTQGITDLLLTRIKAVLDTGKQVMLFINRRGYAPVFFCRQCQWQAKCPHCSSATVYHRQENRLICHHCGLADMPMSHCENCQSNDLIVLGQGTERIEETLFAHFIDTPIIRIDRDTTSRKTQMEQNLAKINTGNPCIIVGTQMLAKGHDFKHLALVGILDIDASLLSIDFRATERLAQLLVQVAGRAGRMDDLGEVYIQTQHPEHQIFSFVKEHYYSQYASLLLHERARAKLPPFSHQALICANAKSKENAIKFSENIAKFLEKENIDGLDIYGPAAAIMEKKADYFYIHLWLQADKRSVLHHAISLVYQLINNGKNKHNVRYFIDVDPIE